jgi:hypothetical protein
VVEALTVRAVAFVMAMALGGPAAGGSEDQVSLDGLAILAGHLNLHVLSRGAESGGVFDEALVTTVEAEDGLGDGGVGDGPKDGAETAVD